MSMYDSDPMIRSFKIPSNKVHFRKHVRYGTWSVNFDAGGIPRVLQGEFTSFQALYDKTDFYLSHRLKNMKCHIGEELTGPADAN